MRTGFVIFLRGDTNDRRDHKMDEPGRRAGAGAGDSIGNRAVHCAVSGIWGNVGLGR